MDRLTILKATDCDLTRLPLGARAAFLLSQLDGQVTLEDAAEIVGIALDEVVQLAKVLVDHGAVTEVAARQVNVRGSGAKRGAAVEKSSSTGRFDPRVETSSIAPRSSMRERPREASPARTREKVSVRPPVQSAPQPSKSRHLTPRPERRRSRKSLGAQRAVMAPTTAPSTGATQKSPEAAQTATGTSRRRPSSATKAPSRRLNAVAAQAAKPEQLVAQAAPQVTVVLEKARAKPVEIALSVESESAPASGTAAISERATAITAPVNIAERVGRLRAGALEVRIQANVDLLVKAAEDALRANDVMSAANNYRLALSHRDDPHLRMKFDEVDAKARIVRFEKNIAPARAAEKDQRWADAAIFFERAHEARPDPDVAMGAANALRLSGGDLRRATALAEQAVSRDANNVAYRITLAEIHLAANRLDAAQEASANAAALAPKDARVKDLAAAIARRVKA